MQVVPPKKQEIWGWPAVAGFAVGGAAGGFYLLSLLLSIIVRGGAGLNEPVRFGLFAVLLIGGGFLLLGMESGRPERAPNLFRNFRRSWISLETLAATVFVASAAADLFLPHTLLKALAAVACFGLILSQGFVAYRSRAVPAWNVSLTPLVFLSSSFYSGSGLLLFVAADTSPSTTVSLALGLFWGMMDLAVWLLYLRGAHDEPFQEATRSLRRCASMTFTVGFGHLFPISLLLLLLVKPQFAISTRLLLLAGLAMVFGGAVHKIAVIRWAGYLRGISLTTRIPVADRHP